MKILTNLKAFIQNQSLSQKIQSLSPSQPIKVIGGVSAIMHVFFSYHVFSSTGNGGSKFFTEFENLNPFSSYDTSKLGPTHSFWAKSVQNPGKILSLNH